MLFKYEIRVTFTHVKMNIPTKIITIKKANMVQQVHINSYRSLKLLEHQFWIKFIIEILLSKTKFVVKGKSHQREIKSSDR